MEADVKRSQRYKQVTDDLRHRICVGEWRPGEKLPRLNDLQAQYGLKSRSGMDKVIKALKDEGMVTGVQGSGITVRRWAPIERDIVDNLRVEYRRAVAQEILDGLFEAVTGVEVDVQIVYERIPAPAKVADLLRIEPDAPVLCRRFLYTVQDTGNRHQTARSYMPVDLADQAWLVDETRERTGIGTMYHLYAAGIPVDRADIEIVSRMPKATEVEELRIQPGTPVFEHWRTLVSQGRPVEVSSSIVRSDNIKYVLHVDLEGGAA